MCAVSTYEATRRIALHLMCHEILMLRPPWRASLFSKDQSRCFLGWLSLAQISLVTVPFILTRAGHYYHDYYPKEYSDVDTITVIPPM